MKEFVREHLRLVTALVSAVSLALVFSAAGGFVPDSLLPRIDGLIAVIPHVNAALSGLAIVMILLGVRAIRNGDITNHRKAMVTSAAIFGLFLVLYLYRVSLEGPTEFTGPEELRRFVYLPLLAIHILLAMVCVPLVYYALLLAGTHSVSELPDTPHASVGRMAASLWLVSFSLGIIVWFMLHVL